VKIFLVPLKYYKRTVNCIGYTSSICTFSIFYKIDRYFYAQFYWLRGVIKPKAKDDVPLSHCFIFYKNITFNKYYIFINICYHKLLRDSKVGHK